MTSNHKFDTMNWCNKLYDMNITMFQFCDLPESLQIRSFVKTAIAKKWVRIVAKINRINVYKIYNRITAPNALSNIDPEQYELDNLLYDTDSLFFDDDFIENIIKGY